MRIVKGETVEVGAQWLAGRADGRGDGAEALNRGWRLRHDPALRWHEGREIDRRHQQGEATFFRVADRGLATDLYAELTEFETELGR